MTDIRVQTIETVSERLIAMIGADQVDAARRRLRRKSVYIVAGFVAGYFLALLSGSPILVGLGVVAVMVCSYASITSVMHDANHGAMFESPRLNRIAGYWLDMFGASSMVWCFKHNDVHHEHANVNELDPDVQQNPFLRLNRYQKWHSWYRFQHVYAPVLYGFMTIQVFLADFSNLVKVHLSGDRTNRPRVRDLVGFGAGKVMFVLWAVVVPVALHGWWGAALAFLTMWVVGVALALTVQVAHAVGDVDHYEHADDDSIQSFVHHQASVSADVATNGFGGRVFAWLAGGLDRQVAHHLVPSLPHTLYPALQAHIEELCAEYGTRYRSHKSVAAAVAAHFRWLHALGQRPVVAGAAG